MKTIHTDSFARASIPQRSSDRLLVKMLAHLACITLLFMAGGCADDDGPPRVAVEGEVLFDGQPLKKGSILFIPTAGTHGPQVGGTIVDGRYQIPEDEGPVIGKMRVEIRAEQQLGFDMSDPEAFAPNANKPLPRNEIPAKHNDQSTLVETTTADGPNEFDFKLKN